MLLCLRKSIEKMTSDLFSERKCELGASFTFYLAINLHLLDMFDSSSNCQKRFPKVYSSLQYISIVVNAIGQNFIVKDSVFSALII